MTSYRAAVVRRNSRHSYSYERGRGGWEIDEDYDELDWRPNIDYIMAANGNLVNALHPEDTLESRNYRVHREFGRGSYGYKRWETRFDDVDDDREVRRAERRAERSVDSLDRAINAIDREKERKMDSLDRAMEAIEREKERLKD
jgi:hypothetical protein